jgi:hypothetical protein
LLAQEGTIEGTEAVAEVSWENFRLGVKLGQPGQNLVSDMESSDGPSIGQETHQQRAQRAAHVVIELCDEGLWVSTGTRRSQPTLVEA